MLWNVQELNVSTNSIVRQNLTVAQKLDCVQKLKMTSSIYMTHQPPQRGHDTTRWQLQQYRPNKTWQGSTRAQTRVESRPSCLSSKMVWFFFVPYYIDYQLFYKRTQTRHGPYVGLKKFTSCIVPHPLPVNSAWVLVPSTQNGWG